MHASAGDNIGNASGTDSVGNEQQQQQEDFRSMAKKSDQPTSVPKDKHSVTKRLQQELLSLMMSGENGVSAFPDGDNLFRWIGTISGPIGTVLLPLFTDWLQTLKIFFQYNASNLLETIKRKVYEGLEYRLILEFPNGYPIAAPRVRFETSCFHPNVDESGNICLGLTINHTNNKPQVDV